jgi:SAM-dependent methyltransferase
MPMKWMDVSWLSFNTLLLLERIQLSWFPGWLPEGELAIALQANPTVEWYLRHKCPEISVWVDKVISQVPQNPPPAGQIRQAEVRVLASIMDLVVYVHDPSIYDAQPFLGWDSKELTSLVDFTGKVVIDVGAGTGRLALLAAPRARAVFAVEPVGNLRHYLKIKAREMGFANVYPVDGLITDIPFPATFVDVTMTGHVFGDFPEVEYREMLRVTRHGGMIILCPGTSASEREEAAHQFLLAEGFEYAWYEEPKEGRVRKYWKHV